MIKEFNRGIEIKKTIETADLKTRLENDPIFIQMELKREPKEQTFDELKVYLNQKRVTKWLDRRSRTVKPIRQNLNEIQDMWKINLAELNNIKDSGMPKKKTINEISGFCSRLFDFWDT
jgi:hypothetical protein